VVEFLMNIFASFRPAGPNAGALRMPDRESGSASEAPCPRLASALTGLIERPDFPCVGAKSALAQGNLAILTAGSLCSGLDDARIHRRLVEWGRADGGRGDKFRSLAVVFAKPKRVDEEGFEALLWQRLGALIERDRRCGHAPAKGFSVDPDHPDFALSFGGAAYFAVGLHPGASRRARRLPFPAIVFNLHSQFKRLRAEHRYERMREVILARDEAFDGTVNPMLARHGEVTEARQYSGRAVDADWVCPFAPGERA
jgi:FPC/CPF motif-containing protein YcgG